MMSDPERIPGFAHRGQLGAARKRFLLFRALQVSVPFLALLVIDLTGRLTFLRPLLLLLPLLDLRNQVEIWVHYIRRFGVPPLSHCRKMLYLDTLRGYDPVSNSIRPVGSRLSVAGFAGVCLLAAAACWAAWRLTGLSAALYPGAFMLMLGIKAAVRRSRPPAVLYLGASSQTTSQFLLEVMYKAHPLNVIACLHHARMGPVLDDWLGFFSYRTGDDSVWREMVDALVSVSQLVVLDLRKVTQPVEYEIEVSVKNVPHEHLFFVGDEPEHPAIPLERCFAEAPLLEALHTLLWGSAPAPAIAKLKTAHSPISPRWFDRRNGYFSWTPPASWKVQEYDDVRTKVQFIHPTATGVIVRFIVKEAGNLQNALAAGALQKIESLGAQYRLTQSWLLGVPCSEVRVSYANESVMWLFIKNELHFNIQYDAPSLAAFQAHYDTVYRSLGTIEVIEGHNYRADVAHQQRLAQRLHMARLAAESISVQEARQRLAAARAEFAGDAEALAAIDRLQAELAQAQSDGAT